MQQPWIDCGIVLPSNFTLEQFLEISKALKKIEDEYTHPCPQRQGSASHNTVTSQNKETQAPTMATELTSQPSYINGSTQIGNITVDQFTTSMGHSTDHMSLKLSKKPLVTQKPKRIPKLQWWNLNDYLQDMIQTNIM